MIHMSLIVLGSAGSLVHVIFMLMAKGQKDKPNHKTHSKLLLLSCLLSQMAKPKEKAWGTTVQPPLGQSK